VDAATLAKAAQAVAAETETAGLLRRLVRIAIENAGAERGTFVREDEGRPVVVAMGSVEPPDIEVLEPPLPLARCDRVAHGVIHYVRKTGASVVIDDARRDERFAGDARFETGAVRSALGVPAIHQGRLAGVLYLENGLSSGAFPPERIEMVRLLSTHAAVALENARLYDGLRDEVERRRRAEEDLRAALAEVESLKDRLEAENVYLQEELRREHNFDEMVGSSPALLEVLQRIERVAPADSTVLILGETGTGKELVARAIHDRSRRKGRPLVKVNCGAISAGLVESELFGHVRGAFTGAHDDRTGRFELADGGTLFLDEVGELPPETQVKLLRVLQEGEFEPVGSSRTVKVDVRVIAATNRDLDAAVREGRFRADLFYRLNVLPLRVPPLRERRSDVPHLALFFLERFAKRFGKKFEGIARESMERLAAYAWPGNVRELQNVIERAVALEGGGVLHVDAALPAARAAERRRDEAPAAAKAPPAIATLDDAERQHILAALRETAYVIEGPRGAAKLLDLHPNTLRSRMKKLGIRRPAASHETRA
jgi:formate hydrogenlyase transcriptional activator